MATDPKGSATNKGAKTPSFQDTNVDPAKTDDPKLTETETDDTKTDDTKTDDTKTDGKDLETNRDTESQAQHDRYPTPQDDAAATGTVGMNHGDVNPVTATVGELERAQVDTTETDRIASLPPVNLYNPNQGLRPRVGGPYLDNVELEDQERRRAIIEGRKPDYTNMAGTAGVPLVTAGQLANMVGGGNPAVADFIEANADNPKLGPTPVTQAPFVGEVLEVVETSLEEQRARREWDNTRVTSHDQPGVVFSDPAVSEKMPSADTNSSDTKVEKK